MPAKLTIQDAHEVFRGRGFLLLSAEYVNSEFPMSYICTCGKESKMSLKNAKKGRSCADCGRLSASKTKTTKFSEIVKLFAEADCTLLSTTYKTRDKLAYKCRCGDAVVISLRHAKHHGIGCKTCGYKKIGDTKRKYSLEQVQLLFQQQGKILLATEFKNSITPMPYVCSCGNYSTTNLNNFFKGKDCWECRNNKISEKGKDPNITDEERELRRSLREHKQFRIGVFLRDNYTCQCCKERGGELNAHHILNFADNPDVRTDIANGITLCEGCHITFHKTYGYRNTTKEQLADYLVSSFNSPSTEASEEVDV